MPDPTEENPDPRADLDSALRVSEWWTPGRKRYESTEPGAPSWWKGEEEASESFMREMGIKLGPNGEVIRTK